MKEKLIYFIKMITGKAYKELKEEWEKQNIFIDKLTVEKNKYKKEKDHLEEYIEKLEADINIFSAKLERQKRKHEKEIDDTTEEMQGMIEALRMDNENLEHELEETGNKLALKEVQRRKAVGEKSAVIKKLSKSEKEVESLKNEITKLEEQIEFLKKHRRAPDIEEIKDYTLGRKRKKSEKK